MIYVSGKMTGIKDFNHPEFNRVSKGLRNAGHHVFNPAEIEISTDGLNSEQIWQAYMDICIPAINKCNTIYMLKGWEDSRGAKLELKKAIENNLIIKQQGDFV